ncbi:RCC1 and BTB domain-containing protein 2-like [Oppia nitens]|uniref:RCC1 and BTB domain-containing protein 2-like n=1 Tax=Oppia nitens TaxID=1686743 RepID=UPI0023DA097E|nr:RCC1 and BTB domain-containing protein 2-like [Oppia nitens]
MASNEWDDWMQKIVNFYVFKTDGINTNMLFVTNDDRVYGMGANDYGVLGTGDDMCANKPTPISMLKDKRIINFLSGKKFTVFYSSDNCVYSCGNNSWGQLGSEGLVGQLMVTPMKVQINKNNALVHDISCGSDHTLVLTHRHQVYGWGSNRFGQINSRDTAIEVIDTPVLIDFNGNQCIKAVHCCRNTSFALTSDGQVFIWGVTGGETGVEVFNRQLDEPMDCLEYYITCELLLDILKCVRYLHQLEPPVIYRDLKPDNILIANYIENGQVIR